MFVEKAFSIKTIITMIMIIIVVVVGYREKATCKIKSVETLYIYLISNSYSFHLFFLVG